MKVAALIPARIGSTRFPRKMLARIKGKSLIVRTYEMAVQTRLFSEVCVVTDSDDIQKEVELAGGRVLRSTREHESGTDRIAEVAGQIDADVIINIQGDEPFLQKETLQLVIGQFEGMEGLPVQAASLVMPTRDMELVQNPNKVKVLLTRDNYAIYFSRCPIPYKRDEELDVVYYIHIGIYAFRKDALLKFATWQPSPHELIEKLECNRFIDYGMPIKMAVTAHHTSIAVDTPEDINIAEAYLDANK